MKMWKKIIIVIVSFIVIIGGITLGLYIRIQPEIEKKKQQEMLDNQIVEFKDERMHYLACYGIDWNKLCVYGWVPFDVTVKECNELKYINIQNVTLYSIETLDDLLMFPNLEKLRMIIREKDIELELRQKNVEHSKEVLEKLSEVLPQLTSLEVISMGRDVTIENLNFLKDVKGLKIVYIYDNSIKDISALSELKELEYVGLENNEVEDITPLLGLKKVECINIIGNPVCEDKEQMELLKMVFPDAEIFTEGEEEYAQYWKNRAKRKEESNDK
jgi:Leucine-rich repeat (LRR) protein